MKIYKKYNNNVVQTYDDDLQEVIVIGSGIAFNKKPGSWIDERLIEKKFVLQDTYQLEMMSRLLKEIPSEHFEVSEKIISFAEEYLQATLNESIHVTLADHISFTLTRLENGFLIHNPLLWDIRNMYEKEYVIGLFALELIEKQLHIKLPEDEAGSIVMHIISAKLNQQNLAVSTIMKITGQILKIVKYQLKMDLHEDSLTYNRFMTHLKFFAQRIIKNEFVNYGNEEIMKNFMQNYPEAFNGAEMIVKFVEDNYDYHVHEEEKLYLAVHLQKLIQKD